MQHNTETIENEDFIDLFEVFAENPNQIPNELEQVFEKYKDFEGGDYRICERYLKDCEKVGYTFDYGLDGCPYGLHKIETETN